MRQVNAKDDHGDFFSYSIIGEIGSGGDCRVYKVSKGDSIYALKAPKEFDLSAYSAESDETAPVLDGCLLHEGKTDSLEKEAENWARVTARVPNSVVRLIDYNISPCPWMVMEYADCSMADVLTKGEVDISDFIDLLRSLDGIHSQGIVHCDIKPQNILRVGGVWKFSDFGISESIGGSESKGGRRGTVQYMAPEQTDGRFGSPDCRTDIWQMGVLLCHIFEDRSIYGSTTIGEVINDIQSGNYDLSISFHSLVS